MGWKEQVLNWTPTALNDFRNSLGEGARVRTDDELRAILNLVMKSQQIDLLLDLANTQIEELLAINENKWDVIDALMDGDQHKALDLMNLMAGKMKKTLSSELLKSSSELLKSQRVKEGSNVIKFRRHK